MAALVTGGGNGGGLAMDGKTAPGEPAGAAKNGFPAVLQRLDGRAPTDVFAAASVGSGDLKRSHGFCRDEVSRA